MLSKIGFNAVQSTEGYTVRRSDRTHVEYREGDWIARIEVEAAQVGTEKYYLAVFSATLTSLKSGPDRRAIADAERAQIVRRIAEGLEFLGDRVVIE